jgi:lipid II:glycine glycyltransferase (peptidoglycan interpeptide bridge formation enzyme)
MGLSLAARAGIAAPPLELDVVADRTSWDDLVVTSTGGNILQSYQWGQFRSELDWHPARVALGPGDRLVAGAQILFRTTPLGKLAYVPRGPVLAPGQEELLPELLAALHRFAREQGAMALKIEPDWPDNLGMSNRLRAMGYRPAPAMQPRSTTVLDLTDDDRRLRAALSPRTRHNVGYATRRGVEVTWEDAASLPVFYDLLQQTSQRHHFPIRPLAYYEHLWRHLAINSQVRLAVARYEGQPLSAALLLTMGQSAYYMYGGSSSAHRGLPASDLLQWEAIRWARSAGYTTYDFWGIPDEVGRQASRRASEGEADEPVSRHLWGVYHYKRGFGGRLVRYLGAYDYVFAPRRYWLWRVAVPRVRALWRAADR